MKNLIMVLSLALLTLNTWAGPGGGPSDEERVAMDECLDELGIEKPARPERGSEPSEEDRQNMDKIISCLSEKGFELKRPRGHGKRKDQ